MRRGNLISGNTTSCGCRQQEAARENGELGVTHGESNSVEYKLWIGMRRRCIDPNHHNYPRYGARGIAVCDEWMNDFARFLADVGRRPSAKHTLEREDVNDHYRPSNVRWATAAEQQWNRRDSRKVIFEGKEISAAELVAKSALDISVNAFMRRINRGWTVERAITEPVQRPRRVLERA